ncbi:metal-dependent phosphohydrolase, HD domain [Formosa agariphila KMM 3901]|uniref:Metal-dependent phosphohydrolase, HD domain n=1 Tax=Formosa agariphila (strain DSM 15362 / KCTC 12365 / LMG 23005 / KMM 3901 / M-2Alg 35-1) TaxID=1347342 RepID=T2KNY6_FORAG|nr:Pycsar system effector family protein [Formosa agariphila]CDF80166.1 metal-dependent phosphohydrolase, HD domain [Formosa agariphila KMM 3901]
MINKLLEQAELFVSNLFENKLSPKNFYHNIEHTKSVLDTVTQLAGRENCTEQDTQLLQMAAWFHDTGYVNVETGHEEESAKIASQFLKDKGMSQVDISVIEDLILATKMDVTPTTLLEQIIKDADCAHVASERYFETSEQLRQELIYKNEQSIPVLDWLNQNKEFFAKHKFYTQSAQVKLQPKKEMNAFNLQKKINKIEAKKVEKAKGKNLGRGVETMFRSTLRNHMQLSAIADTKANILLSVNAIIISVALSNLVPKLDSASNAFLVYPTLVLLIFSVSSIVLSVISTRPNVSNSTVTKEMIMSNQTNILFFGNFYKMSLKDFEWGIDYLMGHEDTMYNALTKDLYYLGLVLERKYRLLRLTYTVFMIGIIISALSFILSYHFFANVT